jgi:hypothetical protein
MSLTTDVRALARIDVDCRTPVGTVDKHQHDLTPQLTAAGYLDSDTSADLVIDFGAPHGIWADSAQVHQRSAEQIVLADRTANAIDEIVVDFGPGVGVWQLGNRDLAAWSRLHDLSPVTFVSGQFH